ncbi:MAG: hypothetical protein ACJ746_14895 [Bryobacteraceae bacterium]
MKSDKERLRARLSIRTQGFVVVPTVLVVLIGIATAQVGSFTKAQVADRIRKVEDGVDEFRKYLETRGDNARDNAQTAQNSGNTRRGRASSSASESNKQRARQTKDDLDEALGDLNRSTNRLRRKFDPTSNYMETRVQVEQVMDDARRVNQVMVKGKYGTQPERYWAALRANVNDLARCYGVTPMGA